MILGGTLDTDGVSTQYPYRVLRYRHWERKIATNGEARYYLGSTTVTTDGSGDAAFSGVVLSGVTLSAGDFVTATATVIDDPGQVGIDDGLAYGSSSELAANVAVSESNAAPVLSGVNNLATINEDAFSNAGDLVSALISGQVTDADTGALSGIAVVAVDNTNGSWEYSINGGSSWTAFGSPAIASARLLEADASTLVRFVPDADWNGTVTGGITYHAWDQTSGTSGGTADLTGTGGSTAFSSAVFAFRHHRHSSQ